MRTRALPRSGSSSVSRGREVGGILLLSLALFVSVSLISLIFSSGTWLGPGGQAVAGALYSVLGIPSLLVAYGIGRAGVHVLASQPLKMRALDTFGVVLAVVSSCTLLDVLLHGHELAGSCVGGMLGDTLAEVGSAVFFRLGTGILALAGFAIGLVLASQVSFRSAGQGLLVASRLGALGARRALGATLAALKVLIPTREELFGPPSEERKNRPRALPRARTKEAEAVPQEVNDPAVDLTVKQEMPPVIEESRPAKERDTQPTTMDQIEEESSTTRPAIILRDKERPKPSAKIDEERPFYIKSGEGEYELPTTSLLNYVEPENAETDKQAMYETAERLVKTLGDFGIRGQVTAIRPGPVVTMYEFVPAPGTKISRIVSLSNDLAMNLEAISVRIVAPIPGKAAVGIEVPNRRRETVYLKEVLCDEAFRGIKSKIALALGKDIEGRPFAVDLGKMPHLLVAGTTGAGKSVCVNAMITSILYNATPEDVRFIMIDPKMLELSIYEGIPHLLLPVVTDPKKANLALRWAVEEMERRYELLAKAGVRDIGSYNRKIARAIDAATQTALPLPSSDKKRIKVLVTSADGKDQEIEVDAEEEGEAIAAAALPEDASQGEANDNEPAPRRLPYIVVVIDEFADLMMVASKEVEAAVMRIAQKARAAGIHLLLATQRPSVDVITGVIKANFPSRIAFQVPSKMDSKVILDQHGAESLLGQGDMLFTDRGLPLRRIHGALVVDEEIKRIVDKLRAQGKPVYDLEILKPRAEDEEEGGSGEPDSDDPTYDQALQLLHEMKQISVSMIQRRLRIGYNRAARIVERMERDGYVAAADGAKPREVLRTPAF